MKKTAKKRVAKTPRRPSTKSTPIKKATDKTALLKAAFLKLYPKLRCNVTATSARIRIDRGTFYDWCEKDPVFGAAAAEAFESLIDHVEDKLHKLIDCMEPSAVYFFLKTRAKKRGYIEKTEFGGDLTLHGQLSIGALKKSEKAYRDGTGS
jgi:hypothetical protein